MSSPEIDVVSWDVDGTLYELPPMMRAVFWAGLRGLLTGPIRTWRELGRLRRFRRAMNRVRARGGVLGGGDMPGDRDELCELEARWYGPAIRRVGVRPGVAEMLAGYRALGLRQIAVSDYRAGYKLAALGLSDAFERVYAGEDLGHLKPSRQLFERVAADLGVDPRRILHIGDRADRDGVAASAVGCQTLILPPGPADSRPLLGSATAE